MTKPDIKYLAVDMDGTLLNTNHQIMPNTREALVEIQKKGIKLIIATGRPLDNIVEYADQLDLAKYEGYIIANNGALIFDYAKDEVIFENLLSLDQARYIFKTLENFDLYPFYRDEERMYVHDVYEAVLDSKTPRGTVNMHEVLSRVGNYKLTEVERLSEYVDHPIYKVMASGASDYINRIYSDLERDLGPSIAIMATYPTVLEFSKKEISKGNALKMLGIDLKYTMAFGDSMNDRDMIEIVEYGIAMENAMDPIKDEAIYITSSNDDEGIYKALKKFELID